MSIPPPADPTPSTPGVPAGWYPDATTGRTRWWNGTEWTNDFAPPPAAPVQYAAPVVYGHVGYAQPMYARAPEAPGNGIAVAAFVLGIVSLVLRVALYFLTGGGFGNIYGLFLIVPAILAIVFGAVGIARARRVGRGLPLAIIGLALGVLMLLQSVAGLFGFGFYF